MLTAAPWRGPSLKVSSLSSAVLLVALIWEFASAQEHGQRHVARSSADTSPLPSWHPPVGPIADLNDTDSMCAFGVFILSGDSCTCAQSQCTICEHFSTCRECRPGYLLDKGKCLPRWMYRRSRSTETYDGDSAFYTLFKFLFLFLIMLPCLVLYAIRNMHRRHRAGPSEISMYSMPPLLVATAGTDRHHRTIDSQEAGDEESESAALLAPSGERVKPANAVLVVGPMGSIEVGVEQDQEGEGEDDSQTMVCSNEQSSAGRSQPMAHTDS